MESHRERIISINRVDLNYKPIEWIGDSPTAQDKDILNAENNSFHCRLFLLVTQGILVLKELHPDLICDSCSPEKFCPLGPQRVLGIKYEDLETVIRFPQFPQKLVLFFNLDTYNENGEVKGQIKYQMTLNMPGFTNCAKLFGSLMTIMRTVDYKREELKKA